MINDHDYGAVGDLLNTDKIMNDSFWIVLYPGMGDEAIEYMIKTILEHLGNRHKRLGK